MTLYIYFAFFFLLGLIFGSFANVCVARIPKDESVMFPRSYCPKCRQQISWFDNIPLLSYIALGGKCRICSQKISIQYPVVELVTGIAFALTALHFKGSSLLPAYLAITFILIVISFIDLNCQIIPDGLSYTLILVGLCASPFDQQLGAAISQRAVNSLLGMAAGGGSLFLIGYAGEKLLRKEAMGGGDVKLMAGIGAVLGWSKVFPVLFLASVIGSAFGLILIITKRIERSGYIPFGPFLSAAAYMNIFIPNIVNAFLGKGI